jgi:ribosomal protein S27E
MKVYFITSNWKSDLFRDAIDAAIRRGDRAFAASVVLDDDPTVSVAEELRATTCLIDRAEIVITFPDRRSGEWTRLEEAYAESKGKQIYSVENYIDDENRQWRPIQAPKAGEDPPEPAPKIVPEHGSRTARLFGMAAAAQKEGMDVRRADNGHGFRGFLLIRCPNCGKDKPFYMRDPITFFKCRDCGERVDLVPAAMFPAYATCPKRCGQRQVKYMTNAVPGYGGELRTDCMTCHAPIVMTPARTGTAWTTKEGAGA